MTNNELARALEGVLGAVPADDQPVSPLVVQGLADVVLLANGQPTEDEIAVMRARSLEERPPVEPPAIPPVAPPMEDRPPPPEMPTDTNAPRPGGTW